MFQKQNWYMHCRTRAVSNQELIIDYIYLYTVYISQGKTIYELYSETRNEDK